MFDPPKTKEGREYDRWIDRIVPDAFRASAPPGVVYHYTDWNAVEAIITSRKIRATYFRQMDADANECRHADPLIMQVAARLLRDPRLKRSTAAAHIVQYFLDHYVEEMLGAKEGLNFYIACFCLAADDPQLWKSFGRDGQGYSLGVKLLEHERIAPKNGLIHFPMQVIYEPGDVEGRTEKLFRRIVTRLDSYSSRTAHELQNLCWSAMLRAALFTNLSHKPADKFAAEREWRIVVWPRGREANPERYVYVPARVHDRRVALESVHVGAKNGQAGVNRVVEFLRAQGYGTEEPMPKVTLSEHAGPKAA